LPAARRFDLPLSPGELILALQRRMDFWQSGLWHWILRPSLREQHGMSGQRQLHLGAFMRPTSIHTGAWRYPGAYPDANFNFGHIRRFAQTLEQAKFDAFFMADHLAVLNMPLEALKHSHTVTSFEPFTLLSALAMVTERMGLVATGSTTFDAPFHVARRFASLDHLSNGRAGWNIVTTSNPDAARNFGITDHMEHAERYRRAREFFDVVTGLWDSWADDAFIRDTARGLYFDPDKLHVLDHKGPYLQVRGPLHIARPVQGWPVIVQAGASDAGRQLAAETAEAVFTAQGNIAAGREFYADVKGRMEKAGRARDHMKIMPACFVVVGETVEEARAKRATLDSLVHYDSAIASLSIALGHDASKFDPDRPLPEIPESNASKSARDRVVEMGRRENLTVRQLAQRLGGYSGLAMVGTAVTIADEMEAWLGSEACDGFIIMFPYLPGGLDDFAGKVVPELQRRGLFRRDYEGTTLREHLGLPRPANRFFGTRRAAE
jgi:FMN-dependent oxidoreductase (nitrilotriacetate monooxygenase family)